MTATARLVGREAGLTGDEVETYVARIADALEVGDVDTAYEALTDWLGRELRYAQAGRAANLPELLRSALAMLAWSVERVPRPSAARAA